MNKDMFSKILVMGVVVLFIGACVVPSIGGKLGGLDVDEKNTGISSPISDSSLLTFHTFDKTGKKQCDVVLLEDVALDIHDVLEELKYKIVYEPRSDETQALKIEFVDLLDLYGLIPAGLSKSYVLSLLNPSWLEDKQSMPRVRPIVPLLRGFVSRIMGAFVKLQQFFKIRFGNAVPQGFDEDILLSLPFSETGTATFCSMGSGGSGGTLPLFMLPRPRGIALWSATEGVTAAAELLTGKGFTAFGVQSGLALGFVGLGLTFAIPGEMVYGFIGYALFTSVSADNIEFFPPNQEPVISDENPPDGTENVPLSLSDLSFRISDPEGKLMSYTVTTEPDIGSGSGILKPNGVYSVPISSLEYDKTYSWTVKATDDKDTTVKQFSFFTVFGPPFDPLDEGWQYRKKITIDNTQVDGDLTSFPVLISTTDVDLRDKTQSDGDDILFMDGPSVASRLFHEIEYFDGSSGELVAWVNIPSLSSGVDTVLYMYYGNPGCSSQQLPERVWNSGYEGVFHFDEASGSIIDSTSNGYYGTASGDPEYHQTDTITGRYSIYFDSGEDDYFEDVFPGSIINPLVDNGHTIEIWCKFDGIPSEENLNALWFSHTGVADRYYCMARVGQYYTNLKDSGRFWGVIDNTLWHHVLIDINSEYDWFAYLDKVHQYTRENFGDYTLGEPVDIAGADGDMCWIGWIDEFRLSNVQRSQVWRDATYETISDPSSFFSVGPEESAP